MKKIIILIVLMGLITPLSANNKIKTDEDLSSFMTGYHEKPQPEMIIDAIKFLTRKNNMRTNAIPPMIGFFNRVFDDNKKYHKEWKSVIEQAQSPSKKIFMFSITVKHEDLLAKLKPSAATNDMLWGAYFASADEKYLEILYKRAAYSVERKDLNLFLTGSTAKWSLCSNVNNHAKVKKYFKNKLAKDKDNSLLKDILSKNSAVFRHETVNVIKKQRADKVWTEQTFKEFTKFQKNEMKNFIESFN